MTPRRPALKARTIKASDELWFAAMAAAEERGEYLSEVIRRLLAEYVAQGADSAHDVGAPPR